MFAAPIATATADQIAFSCGADICLVNPDNPAAVTNLTRTVPESGNDASEYYPTWSPDGTRIAYAGTYGTALSDIYTISATDSAGSANATNVSDTADRSADGNGLQWSSNGSRLTYAESYSSGMLGNDVFVSPASGLSDPVAIGSTVGQESGPTWSPDGTRIAFARRGSTGNELIIGNADGSGTPAALAGGGLGIFPSWSPDGTRIAAIYAPFAGSSGDIVRVIKADGTGQYVDLGTSTGSIDEVAWSPDNTRVAWIDAPSGVIYVRAANGSTPAVAIPHTGALTPREISWSPDGTRLAFDAYTTAYNYRQIFLAKADGSQQAAAITNMASENQQTDWKPGPVTGPPVVPPVPTPDPPATRPAATIRLAALGRGSGPINPFVLSVSVDCNARQSAPSTNPICLAKGDGFTKAASFQHRLPAAKPKRNKLVKVVTAKTKIAAGKTKKLKFKITGAGRKLLRPGRKVKVTLKFRVTQPGLRTVAASKTITLKAPKKKGKKKG